MTSKTLYRASVLAAAVLTAGCDPLEVSNPTTILGSELESAVGANNLRIDAMRHFYIATSHGALASGLLADEFFSDPSATFTATGRLSDEEMLDRRSSERYENLAGAQIDGGVYGRWGRIRVAVAEALPLVREYAPAAVRSEHLAQMFAARGFVALRLAEDFCPGFPLNDQVDHKLVPGTPLTTDKAFEAALKELDSALVYAPAGSNVRYLVQVGRGRAFLGMGDFTSAQTAAAGVPTSFVWNAEYSTSDFQQYNLLFFGRFNDRSRSVSNNEAINGLNYVSAGDPRLPTTQYGTARDLVTPLYRATKYNSQGAPIVIASGIEARLIEAEALLNAGDGEWLTILNDLRANYSTPMTPLVDPIAAAARDDMLFRERAFWLFGTGHRLADLRRLITHYDRNSETVFPTGPYRLGGEYETATSIPFPASLEKPYNPAVTGCFSR